MLRLLLAALFLLQFSANAYPQGSMGSHHFESEEDSLTIQITLNNDKIIIGRRYSMNEKTITLQEWKEANAGEWNNSELILEKNSISRIEFLSGDSTEPGIMHGNKVWFWGGIMIVMMVVMIGGGITH